MIDIDIFTDALHLMYSTCSQMYNNEVSSAMHYSGERYLVGECVQVDPKGGFIERSQQNIPTRTLVVGYNFFRISLPIYAVI